MTDDEILQKAKYFRDSPFGIGWLPDLIDLVEKWRAIAVDIRAKEIYERDYNITTWEKETNQIFKNMCHLEARRELQVEASNWRKIIGPDEITTIKIAISIMEPLVERAEEDTAIKILRRLISEEDEKA